MLGARTICGPSSRVCLRQHTRHLRAIIKVEHYMYTNYIPLSNQMSLMFACRSNQLAILVALGASGKSHRIEVNRHVRTISGVRESDVRLSSNRLCEVLRRAGHRSVAGR